jgi:hypothetical protein
MSRNLGEFADHVERVLRNSPHGKRVSQAQTLKSNAPQLDHNQYKTMSSSTHQRTGSASEQKPSTAQSRRPASSAAEPRKQTSSSTDETRRQTSSATERRTERTSRTTRETITVRTKSPLKPSSDSKINGRKSRIVEESYAPAKEREKESGSIPGWWRSY